MERVKFDCDSNNAPTYSCNKPGDNSGWYYQSDATDDIIYALHTAIAFIESHAADPDITAEMVERYGRYQEALKRLPKSVYS